MKQAIKQKHPFKRGLLLWISLCMILLSFTGFGETAKAASLNNITANTTLSNGDTLSGTISNCTLTIPSDATVTVTGQIAVSGTVNIVGGGKLVRGGGFANASILKINSGATLNIGTSGLTGVTIDGNSIDVSVNGGGIYNTGGTLNLYSGACLANHYVNKKDPFGGAVYVETGTLNMYDGAVVKDNKATETSSSTSYGGGGIAIYEGASFNMYGGTISGNTASSTFQGTGGGGVYNRGTFTMSGGTISGNSTGRNGGAVHLDGGTNTTVSPVMTMTGGLITGNYSASWAGGIEILAKAGLTITGGKINSNSCASGGGGIELDANGYTGYLKVGGSAEITGNFRGSPQDDVYIDKTITLTGNFTGSIGVTHESSSYNVAGGVFATNTGSYTGMENFFCDGKALVGTLSGTNVVWKASTTALTGITLSTDSPLTGTAISGTLAPSGAFATYQWYRNTSAANSNGTVIVGATESSYTPTADDIGKYLYVVANGTGGCTGKVSSTATTAAVQYGSKVSTPVFGVLGGNYFTAQNVELSCADSGADIYYTTNGSTPTSASTKYTGAISVSSTTTIKAIAIKKDCADSDVASATYTISTITATPYTDTYDGAAHNAVTLTGTQAGDTVTYSENGVDFTENCPQYTDAGNYSVYVKVNRTGTGVWESGKQNIVISRAAGSISITGDCSKSYDGDAVSDPAVSKTGTGAVTYDYYQDNSGVIGSKLSGAPSEAGTYWVKAVMAESVNYTAAEGQRQFTITALTGELSGSITQSAYSNVNLTPLGDIDWAIWGLGTNISLAPGDRRSGGTAISNLTDIDPGTDDALRGLGQFYINHTFRWSDGTNTANASNIYCGLQHNVAATYETGDGFSFTVPANTQKRRLIVYSAVHLAVGELTATLSDGSATKLTLQQDCKNQSNHPSRFVIDYAAGSKNQTLTVKFVSTWNNTDGNGNVQLYAVALSDYHLATIKTNKDGVPTNISGSVELKQDGDTVATATSGETGVYSALVLNGTYDIYIGGKNTGKNITINATDNSTTLNYYTVSYGVADAGKASDSHISATAGGSALTSGSAVISGERVVITATGDGASTYTYAWTGDGTGGQTTAALTISSLSCKVDALCTVTGKINLNAPTILAWDSTTPGKATWSEVTNASGYTVQLYKDGSPQGSAISVDHDTLGYNFTSVITAAGNGAYTFKVTVNGDGTDYNDSGVSPASGKYVYNNAPSFVGGTTSITVDESSSSNSVKDILHARDVDSGQTLTWSEYTAPQHGSLTISGATASSGSEDISAGGTIAYKPAADYYGNDSFTIQVSDGKDTDTRTIYVTVTPVPDELAAPTGLVWDSTTPGKATWSEVTDANGYTVQLYKDGAPQGSAVSVGPDAFGYDFSSIIAAAGNGVYTFTVTAVGDGINYSDSTAASPGGGFSYTAPVKADPAGNSMSINPASVKPGDLVAISAKGDRQDKSGVAPGDERYIPVSWASAETGKTGGFAKNSSGYNATYTPSAPGNYTVTVTFEKQIYNGKTWVSSGITATKNAAVTVLQKYFTVRFEDWDGKLLKSDNVETGKSATAPDDPDRTGYTFTGWSASFNAITADTTITAQYKIKSYTVLFKDWDGTVLKSQTVQYEKAAVAPDDPEREGYAFIGWSTDYDKITANKTVTAQYTINSYTVTFNSNGGGSVPNQTVKYQGFVNQPDAPSRNGFVFKGWYKDSALELPFDFAKEKVDGNLALYAKWQKSTNALNEAAKTLSLEKAFQFAGGDTWECVTSDFIILNAQTSGVQISWKSSDENAVKIEGSGQSVKGVVSRPKDRDTSVVMTATISLDGTSVTKTFLLIIKRQGASKDETRETTNRTAAVQIGQNTGADKIYRTVLNDGTNIDTVIVTPETVQNLIKQGDGNGTAQIVLHKYEASPANEYAFEVSEESVAALAGKGLGLTMSSPGGSVTLLPEAIRKADENGMELYFHIVPVPGETKEAKAAFKHDGMILSMGNADTKEVYGTPRIIQTNMEGYSTIVRLPLEGISEDKLKDPKFISTLCIYAEHDDGTTELINGKIVYEGSKPSAIEFKVSSFSRFQIVSVGGGSPWLTIVLVSGGTLIIILLLILFIILRKRKKSKSHDNGASMY